MTISNVCATIREMKTVLILTSGKSSQGIDSEERFRYVQEFCDAVEAKLSRARVRFATYEDIEISVVGGKATLYDTRNKLNLAKVSLVHFKNWINDTQTSGMLARYFASRDIATFNSEVAHAPARTKIAQMVLCAENNLPVPDTYFASRERMVSRLKDEHSLPDGISLPFIIKANDGAKGNDNYLIRDLAKAHDVLTQAPDGQEFVMQAFHPNDGDYRLLYVGFEQHPLVFVRRAKAGSNSHLNNTSQGGSGEFVDASTVPSDYLMIARQAAELTGREIGGVDILVDNVTNQPYLLEVNQTPALATGFGVKEKVLRFVDLVESCVDTEEEE